MATTKKRAAPATDAPPGVNVPPYTNDPSRTLMSAQRDATRLYRDIDGVTTHAAKARHLAGLFAAIATLEERLATGRHEVFVEPRDDSPERRRLKEEALGNELANFRNAVDGAWRSLDGANVDDGRLQLDAAETLRRTIDRCARECRAVTRSLRGGDELPLEHYYYHSHPGGDALCCARRVIMAFTLSCAESAVVTKLWAEQQQVRDLVALRLRVQRGRPSENPSAKRVDRDDFDAAFAALCRSIGLGVRSRRAMKSRNERAAAKKNI